jgi:predicted DNA-binding transcriptional regulator AlpA
MASAFIALIGLIVLGLGLLVLWLSMVSFAQGMRDFSIWVSFSLALFLIFAGNFTYKKFQKRRFINKSQVAQLFGVKKSIIDRWLLDGKLPKPRRRFGFRRWDYDELLVLLKRQSKI